MGGDREVDVRVRVRYRSHGNSLCFPLSQYLAVDVKRLNSSLLRWFREGVAAALACPAGHVHINRLNVRLACFIITL